MKIKVNDKVVVITGKYKGKTGKVVKTNQSKEQVIVEKINMVTRHVRKTPRAPGNKVKKEAPLHISNVMLLCPKTNKPSRIGYRLLKDGKKERYAKVSGESLL